MNSDNIIFLIFTTVAMGAVLFFSVTMVGLYVAAVAMVL